MRRMLIAAAIGLAALLGGSPAGAQSPATCGGRDLAAELRQRDPAKFDAALARARATFPNLDGRLWRIERPGTPPSLLFGTMHVTDPRATIPAELSATIPRARAIAVELEDAIIEGPRSQALVERMTERAMNPEQDSLSSLSQAERQFVQHHLQMRGLPLEATTAFQPWFLYLLVSLPACEMQRHAQNPSAVLDSRVLAARAPGASVVSLETVDEQVDALAGLPAEAAMKAIVPTLRLMSANDDLFATMLALYQAGQVGAAVDIAMALGIGTEADRAVTMAMVDLLKGTRDRLMAERALPLLAEGNVVIAVGALHLIGEGGLVQRFRDAGYTLTRIE
jgi:uncharacterized protein YbaP (TraB family)